MQIVIEIDEEEYNIIKNFNAPMTWAEHLIAAGTPLPKGHGRLIDGMVVRADINNVSEGYGEPYIVAKVVDGKLWYYGRYDTQERADEVSDTLNDNNEAAIVLKKI